MTNTTTTFKTYDTLQDAMTAAHKEYSQAQNKAYNMGIWAQEVEDGYQAEAVPQGHPAQQGWWKVETYRSGKWIENKSGVKGLYGYAGY